MPGRIGIIPPWEKVNIDKVHQPTAAGGLFFLFIFLFVCADPEFCIGQKNVLWQEKISQVQLAPVWKTLEELNEDGRFGFFIGLAKHSRANIYKLQASSFVERVNSAGKIVLNDTNIKLKADKVEKRVMLRMNRKWMAHMKEIYDETHGDDMMGLLRASHDALQDTSPLTPEELQELLAPKAVPQPQRTSDPVIETPHWPPSQVLDRDLGLVLSASAPE